jgi:hypothetical protein
MTHGYLKLDLMDLFSSTHQWKSFVILEDMNASENGLKHKIIIHTLLEDLNSKSMEMEKEHLLMEPLFVKLEESLALMLS